MEAESFFQVLWTTIVGALTLDANALMSSLAQPYASWIAVCVALLAGISRLVGDSVALFINHVSPHRVGMALLGSGVTFVLELALWAVSIWLIATAFFGVDKSLSVALMVVALASAPWLLGFLVFVPYLGELVRWVLRIWSWLIGTWSCWVRRLICQYLPHSLPQRSAGSCSARSLSCSLENRT